MKEKKILTSSRARPQLLSNYTKLSATVIFFKPVYRLLIFLFQPWKQWVIRPGKQITFFFIYRTSIPIDEKKSKNPPICLHENKKSYKINIKVGRYQMVLFLGFKDRCKSLKIQYLWWILMRSFINKKTKNDLCYRMQLKKSQPWFYFFFF